MGILRYNAELVRRVVASSDSVDTGPLVIRPGDGDGSSDRDQQFGMIVFADQTGAGSVKVEALNSFGDGLWFLAGDESSVADGAHMMLFGEMQMFAPYLKFRATATPPDGSEVKPTFRVIARIASNGPFRLLPADVPDLIETTPTDDFDFNDPNADQPPPEGP